MNDDHRNYGPTTDAILKQRHDDTLAQLALERDGLVEELSKGGPLSESEIEALEQSRQPLVKTGQGAYEHLHHIEPYVFNPFSFVVGGVILITAVVAIVYGLILIFGGKS